MSVKISTETNITSVLQTLQNIRGSTYWECENYYNLYWNKDTNELKVCGFQGESSYEIIKRCPFLNVKEYDILSEERLIAYLSDGFRIILPISTKGIGMEGADYFHNVFVSELINQKTVKIYDFWRPKFKWDFREIKICDAIKGICVSAETNQRIIIFSPLQTKKENNVNGVARSTTVLLSNQFDNVDMTMYNNKRLIEKSNTSFDNPILVDWQFCRDTSAGIGDNVSFVINGNTVEYKIYAIYETNSIYDGGAILVQISDEQKEMISQNAKSNGYSGMYISASDYDVCRSYLISDYRPLGRLKSREQFESDEQYNVHYNAIMDSGYSNEITDFRVRKTSLDGKQNIQFVLLGTGLTAVLLIAFNIVMAKRGSEKAYFVKHCLPKGINVKPYYFVSFFFETLFFVLSYSAVLIFKIKHSAEFIPDSVYNIDLAVIPLVGIVAEIVALIGNITRISISKQSIKRNKNSADTNGEKSNEE